MHLIDLWQRTGLYKKIYVLCQNSFSGVFCGWIVNIPNIFEDTTTGALQM